jgi:alpha-L-rhamnosidase
VTRVLARSVLAGATCLALALAGLAGSTPPASAAGATVQLDDLQANARTKPLGIPGDAPSLSWHAESSSRAVLQTGYQVRVATTESGLSSPDVWDSGQVSSDRQVDVPYAGPTLTSQTRYYWQVRTWDDGDTTPTAWSDATYFETGLLAASDWQGQWITSNDPWTDYRTTVSFHLDNLGFGVFFRGADANNGYMWELTVADGTPRLKLHSRVNGTYTVLKTVDLSSRTTAAALRTGDHTLSVTTKGNAIETRLDGAVVDQSSATTFGRGYVGIRTATVAQGAEAVTVHSVQVTTPAGASLLNTGFDDGRNPFSAGTVSHGDLAVSGDALATYVVPTSSLPLMRDQFATTPGKTIASARVYASARGVYQLSIDGKPVGDQHLAPGYTSYSQRIQSQTYDVTGLLSSGANTIGAELGAGWYAGRNGNKAAGLYGTDTSLIAQLRIDYTDGTHQVVTTDPSWTWHPGPFVQSDNIDGETFDATKAQPAFDTPGFDARDWVPVSAAADTTSQLVPQPDEPVRTTQVLTAQSRSQVPAGSYIYDLGQEITGVPSVTISGLAGQQVRIRYGEMLNQDGSLYTANLRTAKATDYYTFAADGTVTYTPTFTFHGFRYLEITGMSTPPSVTDVKGEVWGSDLATTGTLQTSDAMLNQLTSNISWGQRDNFLSIPTDTPARDERLGWTGDIGIFAPTASYLRDTRAFMQKYTADLRDSQLATGGLPSYAPSMGEKADGGAAWEDAMILVPYSAYHAFGDTAIVQQNYQAMSKFMTYILWASKSNYVDLHRTVYGDWLALDKRNITPNRLIATAYDALDAQMMSEMATAIGRTGDAGFYAQAATSFRNVIASGIGADGTIAGGTQTGYALVLGMGLVPDSQVAAVGAKFVAKIHADQDHLSTGFVGTGWLLPALSAIGRDDLAYTLLEQKDYPSWGYEIAHGATTVWERWNSIMPDGSFGDVGMNSFNHYAYGAVGSWMYQHIAGISPLAAGYKQIQIAPSLGGGLSHGEGTFDSAYGTIDSSWQQTGKQLYTLHVEVPVNTTAQVVLPSAASASNVLEGGQPLDGDPGVAKVTQGGSTVTVSVGSGTYDFTVSEAPTSQVADPFGLTSLAQNVDVLFGQGDLTADVHDRLEASIDDARHDALSAIAFGAAGDATTEASLLGSATTTVRLLTNRVLRMGITDRTARLIGAQGWGCISSMGQAALKALGVSVQLTTPASAPAGGTVTGAGLTVSNTGTNDVGYLHALVTVEDWGTWQSPVWSLPAGGKTMAPVALQVPTDQGPGPYDAHVDLALKVGSATINVVYVRNGWATVAS